LPPDLPGLHHEYARSDPWAWAGLVAIVASAYLVARLVTWLAMFAALWRWRRSAAAPWVERARLAWSARRLGGFAWLVIAFAVMFAVGRRGDLIPVGVLHFLIAAACLFGGGQAALGWTRRLNPTWALTPRPARGAWAFFVAWLGPMACIGFILFALSPDEWETRSWVLLACGAAAVGGYMAWGWLRLMRWTGVIRPAGDRFRAIASGAAERAGIGLRSIEQAAIPMANAFAFVHDRGIGVTDAALAILDDDELSAVCAHEMAHLGEPGWVRMLRLSFGVLLGLYLSTLIVMLPASRSLSPSTVWLVLLGSPVAMIFAWILFLRLAHRMEIRADAMARRPETSAGTYARALEKIYEANLVPVVLGAKRTTHPELYDRLVAAGVTPEYYRPEAPPSGPRQAGMLMLFLGAVAAYFGVSWLVAALL
jgi:Zn-dependent protease with chaperone function